MMIAGMPVGVLDHPHQYLSQQGEGLPCELRRL